jgi:glycosyltransferase involved in cell wall biosynthesis
VAFFASELTGLPFSFTAHAKDIYTSEPDQLVRKMKKARFVVTCTRYNARYLEELARSSNCDTPVHVVYHGIDLSFFTFSPATRPRPPYQILSIGRLVPKKGYETLLSSLRLLDQAGLDFQFTHIGDGEMKTRISKLTRQLDLTHRVHLLGTLSHDKVIHHYRRAHCFALACKVAPNGDRDGIPNVLIEAMAAGVPTVATNISAIPELVEDGMTGSLVPPDDPVGMAAAIRNVLLHPGKYDAHTKRARARVERDFDNRRCTKQLHALFVEALLTA